MENEEENKFLPIVYYNTIIELRKIFKNRYHILKKYEFNISKIERKFIKDKYKENIPKLFPPYNEKIFINSII